MNTLLRRYRSAILWGNGKQAICKIVGSAPTVMMGLYNSQSVRIDLSEKEDSDAALSQLPRDADFQEWPYSSWQAAVFVPGLSAGA